MSFQSEAFKKYFIASGGKDASANSYSSGLKNIDLALQRAGRVGLDETIASDIGWLRSWVRSTDQPPFDKRPSDQRSFLNKYLYFLHQGDLLEGAQPNGTADDQSPLEPTGQAFQLEREMQSAVRRQISELEGGMRIADGGSERRVATGSVDILARDKDDVLVVIELKAGECPKGAVEQVLGYANDIKLEEGAETVRIALIAKSFSDRILGAASFVPGLKLLVYDYAMTFKEMR